MSVVINGIEYLINEHKRTAQCCGFIADGGWKNDNSIKIYDHVVYFEKTYDVTSIGDRAFCDCDDLLEIVIPEGVVSIGEEAFCGCSSLYKMTIPAGVTSIGDRAFCGCSSLRKMTIPAGVTSIGDRAFCDCKNLIMITLPASLYYIGDGIFDDCDRLIYIDVPYGCKWSYSEMGLSPWEDLIHDKASILQSIAKEHEKRKNMMPAVLYYMRAAHHGAKEAAFRLGELYEEGKYLPQNYGKAADWYEKAYQHYHPTAKKRYDKVLEKEKAKNLFFYTESIVPDHIEITKTDNNRRIIQLNWILTDEQGDVIQIREVWINPRDFVIPQRVTVLTGITQTELIKKGMDIRGILEEFVHIASKSMYLVAPNVEHHVGVIREELYRLGMQEEGDALWAKRRINLY